MEDPFCLAATCWCQLSNTETYRLEISHNIPLQESFGVGCLLLYRAPELERLVGCLGTLACASIVREHDLESSEEGAVDELRYLDMIAAGTWSTAEVQDVRSA